LIPDIEELKRLGAFGDIERHLASYISSFEGGGSPLFFLMVMLLGRCVEAGDVCLSIERFAGKDLSWLSPSDPDNSHIYRDILLPSAEEIISCISKSAAAGKDGERLPLVLSGNRLYFHRYLTFEEETAGLVTSMCEETDDLPDVEVLMPLFRESFPVSGDGPDMQAWAAALSLRRRLSVISGGPGTGKTSTAVRILKIIKEARSMQGLDTAVALTAPTGKAAARLAAAASSFSGPDGRAAGEAPPSFTMHRLLGYSPVAGFRHGRENPLEYDVIVADECSMADLPLMHRLLSSVKKGARLILLGDRDQLASVEGGAVFGDICGAGRAIYSSGIAGFCSRLTGSAAPAEGDGLPAAGDSITILTRNWRFGHESGIGLLASAVRRGDADEAVEILASGAYSDLSWQPAAHRDYLGECIDLAADKYAGSGITGYSAVRGIVSRFCILTALRRGPAGMEGMNSLAENRLAASGYINPDSRYYDGRPVMVTGNDYAIRLFNGDIGIVSGYGADAAALFNTQDGEERRVPCGRLPFHETAYAMTIHKSQGSEFDDVLIVLPGEWNRVMTRELLYTAVTRGRKRVTVAGSEEVIRMTVGSVTERMSGLRDKLHST